MESDFEWDDGNVDHIVEHGVDPDEAEEPLLDPRRAPALAYQVSGEPRRAVLGATVDGRLLSIVFTHR